MYPILLRSAAPVLMPSTSPVVYMEPAKLARLVLSAASEDVSGPPSNEYSDARDAVSTTRPRAGPGPIRTSRWRSSGLLLLAPRNAPLKQQSRMITCWRARQASNLSRIQLADKPVDAGRSLRVSEATKWSSSLSSICPWHEI